jgi:peptidoglycan/LPS O-acetylase OafA/YrhL
MLRAQLVAGSLLAAFVHSRRARTRTPWSASVSALVLTVCFASNLYDAHVWNVLILPAFGGLLLGFAEGAGVDPLCRVLSTWPLPLTKHLALGTYLLHYSVLLLCQYANQRDQLLWKPHAAAWWVLPALVAATSCLAGLVEWGIQRPVGRRLTALLAKRQQPLLRVEPEQGQARGQRGAADGEGVRLEEQQREAHEPVVHAPSDGSAGEPERV